MGRYTYNASKVTQAIDELKNALDSLKDVTSEIQAGINTINNANGARCIEIDYSELLQLQTMAETVIDEDINTIQSKVTIIEEYEKSPWYKKLFSSAGMGLSKFVEGVVSGVENITDGAVSIVGFVGGIFNSEFKNSVAEYVATDHVGDWFDKQYDEGFLSGVSKYSWFSEDSTAANIFKGFGTAAPYIALSMTGVGTTVEVVAAGLSGIGSGTEAGINKALTNDPNLSAGDVFNRAFGEGVWQGAKNAALVYTMNKIRDIAVTTANTPRITDGTNPGQGLTASEKIFTKAGKFSDTGVGNVINTADDFVVNTGKKVGNLVQKVPGVNNLSTKASNVLNAVASNKYVHKVTNAVTNAVNAHPGAVYAAAGTAFALDQVDEDVINSTYRIHENQYNVTTRPMPTLTPTPTPSITITPTISLTPTPTISTTQIPTNTPGPTPTQTYSPVPTNTPGPTITTTSPPSPTITSGPGPTSTSGPIPTTTRPVPTVTTTISQAPTVIPTPTLNPTTTPGPIPTSSRAPYNPTPTIGGGGYTDDGYIGENTNTENVETPEGGDMSGSFTEIVGGNDYINIPTSAAPITTTTTTSAKKSIIPAIAGLGAAAVAGIGAKAYLDKKEENTSEEDFDAEEWTEEDSLDIDYNEAMEEDGDYLNPSDEYAYQEENEDISESYEAVNSSELASMQ